MDPWENRSQRFGHTISIHTDKHYGDNLGSWYSVKDKDEAIQSIRRTIKTWESYDSIAGRRGYKVTSQNTAFSAKGIRITLHEILYGQGDLLWFTT